MPNGPTHRKITIGVQLAGLPIFVYADALFSLGFHTGIFISYWVNNDLDLNIRQLPWFLKIIGFNLYKEIIPHRFGLHRGNYRRFSWWKVIFFSHIPFAGTFLRLILLLWLPVLLLLLVGLVNLLTLIPVLQFLYGVFVGMSTSDTFHTLADLLQTGYKWVVQWLKQKLTAPRELTKRQKKQVKDWYY